MWEQKTLLKIERRGQRDREMGWVLGVALNTIDKMCL